MLMDAVETSYDIPIIVYYYIGAIWNVISFVDVFSGTLRDT